MTETSASGAGTGPGTIVGGYLILGEIGRGGMGTVYVAEHRLLRRLAAIKMLRSEYAGAPSALQRFLDEARALGALRHPGIVEIYDFGYTDSGLAYLAMELLQGSTLSRHLVRVGAMAPRAALAMAQRIALGLAAAHQRGIVHRDLKPDNVFVVDGGDAAASVKILDFGIAKSGDDGIDARTTTAGALLGTPVYMSPEQCHDASSCDYRSDLYSLGCVLFEMLVGRPPFLGASTAEVVAAQVTQPPPLDLLPAGTPRDVIGLLSRLLAKTPGDRPQDADAVAAELGALVMQGGEESAGPARRPSPASRPAPLEAMDGAENTWPSDVTCTTAAHRPPRRRDDAEPMRLALGHAHTQASPAATYLSGPGSSTVYPCATSTSDPSDPATSPPCTPSTPRRSRPTRRPASSKRCALRTP